MLKAGTHVWGIPCKQINRTVPFFEELHKNGSNDKQERESYLGDALEVINLDSELRWSMNEYLYEQIYNLDQTNFNVMDKDSTVGNIEKVPDGTLLIHQLNAEKFDYRLQIMDHLAFQYHRNNGISKIGVVLPPNQTRLAFGGHGRTTYVMRPLEGALQLMDRMNNAYVRTHLNETYIFSGIQYMPFKPPGRQ